MAKDPGRIPGAQTAPSTLQVRLAWTLPNTKTVFNVLHGSVGAGFTPTSTIAQAVYAAVIASAGWTSWKANINSGVSLAFIDLRDMRTVNNALAASTGAATPGTGAGTALPPGDALVVTLRTAAAGKSNRGRVYLPGLDSTALAAGGVAAAGTVTNAKAFIDAVSTALTGQSITLAIPQFARQQYTGAKTNTVHLARPAVAPVIVTTTQCRNNIIDHQRRRAGRS